MISGVHVPHCGVVSSLWDSFLLLPPSAPPHLQGTWLPSVRTGCLMSRIRGNQKACSSLHGKVQSSSLVFAATVEIEMTWPVWLLFCPLGETWVIEHTVHPSQVVTSLCAHLARRSGLGGLCAVAPFGTSIGRNLFCICRPLLHLQ